jgi:nucleotide-binding universal stress UspA family protein
MSGFHPNKIVVPVDLSPESLSAFDTALNIANSSSHVYVLHLVPKLNVAVPRVIGQESDNDIRIQGESRMQDVLETLREQLPEENYVQLQIDLEVDDLGFRLADFAQQVAADLIVMPTHGQTVPSHILFGPLAQRVIRLSHCPVLVLRK